MNINKKKVVVGVTVIGVLCAGGVYLESKDKENRTKAYQEAMDSLKIEFAEAKIEYGTKIDNFEETAKKFVKNYTGKLKIEEAEKIDALKIGIYPIKYTLSTKDKYYREVEKEEELQVVVEDTKLPVITLKSDVVTITEGEEYDPKSNIESVVDEIDGALEYELDNQVDTSKPGEYTVALKAVDKNGNIAEQSFVINVEKKPLPKKHNNGKQNNWNGNINQANTDTNRWTVPSENNNFVANQPQNSGGSEGNSLWEVDMGVLPSSGEVPQEKLNEGYEIFGENSAWSGIDYPDGRSDYFGKDSSGNEISVTVFPDGSREHYVKDSSGNYISVSKMR